MITIPALKRISLKELQEKYFWIKKIERDVSTEEPVTLDILKLRNQATGKELESVGSNLGFQHMLWLLDHQDEFPELLTQAKKEDWWYLLFPATIVVLEGGSRGVPCLGQGGARWCGDWYWLDNSFVSSGRVAVGQVADAMKLKPLPSDTLILSALEKRVEKVESIVQKLKDALYDND